MAFTAGEVVTADKLNRATEKIIARGRRTTTSSNSTGTAVAILRLDDIAIRGGYLYAIRTNALALSTSVANNTIRAQIHYTTDGSTPTTSSSILPGGVTQQVPESTTQSDNSSIMALYAPGSDETLSLLLSVNRSTGSGNGFIFADSTNVMDMWVEQIGLDPGDSGVDL
jgi:hypothetical protein